MQTFELTPGATIAQLKKALPKGGRVVVRSDFAPIEDAWSLGAAFSWEFVGTGRLPFLSFTAATGNRLALAGPHLRGVRYVVDRVGHDIAIDGCEISPHAGDALAFTDRTRSFKARVSINNTTIHPPEQPGKSQGVYVDGFDRVELDNTVIDRTGCTPDMLSHGVYTQRGTHCGVYDCIIIGGPSHAIQCRGGLFLNRSVILDSPCGVVCGGFRDGWSVIESNVFYGGGDIGTNARCFGVEVLPQKQTEITSNVLLHGTTRNPSAAFAVRYSPVPAGETQLTTSPDERHTLSGNVSSIWPGTLVRWWREFPRPASVCPIVESDIPPFDWRARREAGEEWRDIAEAMREHVKAGPFPERP